MSILLDNILKNFSPRVIDENLLDVSQRNSKKISLERVEWMLSFKKHLKKNRIISERVDYKEVAALYKAGIDPRRAIKLYL